MIRVLQVAGRSAAVLLGLLCLGAAGGIFLLSQTVIGRQAARSFAADALRGAVDGRVEVGPVLGGDLLTEAHVAGLTIATRDGTPFLEVEDVRLEYSPLGFLLGDFHFRDVRIGRAELLLHQDDAGRWNFDKLFGGDEGDEDDGEPSDTRFLLTNVTIVSGDLTLRTPWDESTAEGAAVPAADEPAADEESVWRVRRLPGGRAERTIELDSLRGTFPLLRFTDPVRPMRLELRDVEALARVVSQPLRIRRFDGVAVFRDTIAVEIERLETAASELAGDGIVIPGDPERYRFDLRAEPLAFSELGWLPVPVPEEGGGSMDLVIRSPGEGLIVEARDADVRAAGSRVSGDFVLDLRGRPSFRSLDLDLHPLEIALVDDLLERPPSLPGLIRGRARARGPLELLDIDADLRLLDPARGVEASGLHAQGGISVGQPATAMRNLRLGFESFEPRWTRLIGIDPDLGGRVEGTATLDGTAGARLAFTADVRHRLPGDTVSRLRGGGTVDLTEPSRLDVQFDADPLAMSLLEPYAPGVDFLGTVRGPFSATGTLADLRIVADLRTPRGLLNFDGRFDLASATIGYDARLLARGIRLEQLFADAPATRLDVEGHVDGRGTALDSLEASFDLRILPSTVEGARLDTSVLRVSVAEGLARADTFLIRTDVGSVTGRGTFGLAPERSGSLVLDIEAPDLSSWNRWLVPGRRPGVRDTALNDLFVEFQILERRGRGQGVAGGDRPRAEPPDTLAGRVSARGVVYGNVERFAFGGRLEGHGVRYGSVSVDSLALRLDAPNPAAGDSLAVRTVAWGLDAPRVRADSVSASLERMGPGQNRVSLYARRDTSAELELAADVSWTKTRHAARLRELRLGLDAGALRLAGPALVAWSDSGLFVRDLELRGTGGGRVLVDGEIPERGPAHLDVQVAGVELGNVLQLASPAPELRGELGANIQIRGTAASPRIDAGFTVLRPQVGQTVHPRVEGEFLYADRVLSGAIALLADSAASRPATRRVDRVSADARTGAAASGSGGMGYRGAEPGDGARSAPALMRATGDLRLDLSFQPARARLLPGAVNVTIVADSMPLQPLELSFESVRDVEGLVRGRVAVTGDPGDLRFQGEATLLRGAASLLDLGTRYVGMQGTVRFQGAEAHLEEIRFASAAGGSGTVAGTVGLAEFTNPSFDLDVRLSGLRGVQRRTMTVEIDGRGNLGGEYRQPVLTGTFRVSDGEVRVGEYLRERQVVDLTDPRLYSLIDTSLVSEERLVGELRNPFMENLRANLTLHVGPDLWLRSPTLDVELVGTLQLRLDRAEDEVAAFGTLTLRRGKYRYVVGSGANLSSLYSRQLQITGGTIEFVGSPGVNPNLDIHAEYQARTELGPLTIDVAIGGTMLDPTLQMSSDPQLAESDVICYLLFSSACLGVTAQGGEFAASLVREGVLGTVGTQVSQALVGGTDIVDYLDVRSVGPSIGPGGASPSLFSGFTEVEVGRYVGQDLFVRAIQPLTGALPGASVEWGFSPGWTVEARTEDRYRRFSLFTVNAPQTERTYGLFLFREWDW